jgi:hypothetical protein
MKKSPRKFQLLCFILPVKVFKKPDDPEKFEDEALEEKSRRFEYDPWSLQVPIL